MLSHAKLGGVVVYSGSRLAFAPSLCFSALLLLLEWSEGATFSRPLDPSDEAAGYSRLTLSNT